MEADDSIPVQWPLWPPGPQNFRWHLDQQVFQLMGPDYDVAIGLASQWRRRSRKTLPALLLLWPAVAATSGAAHFVSFDPRTRPLTRSAGLELLPQTL